MNQIYTNSRIRVQTNVLTYLKRRLPDGKGKILVAPGQEVVPEDIIGQGEQLSGFRIIHLSSQLNVAPGSGLDYLKRPIGSTFYQGELVAEKNQMWGMNKKIVISPADGVLETYDKNRGVLKLKLLPKKQKIVSGAYGIIDRIDESTGTVVVKTVTDVITGVIGSGIERDGFISIIGLQSSLISSKQISANMQGKIVVGGGMIFLDALEKAVAIGVRGFITGGMNALDFRSISGANWNFSHQKWTDIGMSVAITEGLGMIPIGEDIVEILQKHNNQFAIIDGSQSRLILPQYYPALLEKIRKISSLSEVLSPHPKPPEPVILKEKQLVRVISGAFLGHQGIVERIDQSSTVMESGISCLMITIRMDRGQIRVPHLNIEVIGDY